MKAIKGLKNRILKCMLGIVMISLCLFITKMPVQAKTDTLQEFVDTYSSVSLSPDGTAWTIKGTGSAERNPSHYKLRVGRDVDLKVPGVGEHIYDSLVTGNVDISYWEVRHVDSMCTHGDAHNGDTLYGENFGPICWAEYDNGWFPVCADCGDYVFRYMVYAHSDQLKDINTMVGASSYYYMCPFSSSLEQGIDYEHYCDAISSNRYRVTYVANAPEGCGYSGSTARTYHMYNNDTIYHGEPATYRDTHLRRNGYSITGYVFTGWNTERDGSGTSFTNGQEVLNLTDVNNGNVILFAQWKKVDSTLVIKANGGCYAGYTAPITQGYKSTWTFDESKITAPAGYTTTFNHMGGSGTPSLPSTQSYHYFTISQPVNGLLTGRVYTFLGDNTTDTITIYYKQNSITLPTSTRSGYSFGGWYADSACTNPVGKAGDTYTPTGNTTLYAKWVQLVLTSVDDYDSNGGKGAVDLTWSQPDGSDKTYQIFQYSELDATHKLINSATDIGTTNSVNKSFAYSSAADTYTVPYSGYYTLTLTGAQGGNYSTYTGGLGGRTTATMYLKAGEVLTYNIGGQNGYNGGGTASSFGVGGGYSSVSSNLKGTLLIAGGGGGAGAQSNGYVGGAATSVIAGNTGQAGMAGGGGGYQGGTAGEYIVHTHTADCYVPKNVGQPLSFYEAMADNREYVGSNFGKSYEVWENYFAAGCTGTETGSKVQFIKLKTSNFSVVGGSTLSFGIVSGQNGGAGSSTIPPIYSHVVNVINADTGAVLMTKDIAMVNSVSYTETISEDVNDDDDDTYTVYHWVYNHAENGLTITGTREFNGANGPEPAGDNIITAFTLEIPEGVTNIRIETSANYEKPGGNSNLHAYINTGIINILNCYNEIICGYTEGQVISSKGAYGGSNYVNADYCQSYNSESGVKTGNGAFAIVSTSLGFNDSTILNDVVATDYATPDAISPGSITKTALNKTSVRVAFDEPKDNGTKYYHYVKSYKAVTNAYSLTSNTTLNTLTSGVVKYHYVYDSSATTTITASHTSTASQYIDVAFPALGIKKYLHVATVDKAGNISVTTHIPILSPAEDDSIEFTPKPVTEPIEITLADGVAPGDDARTFYVRSDGITEIELTDSAYLEDDGSRVVAQVDAVRFNVCNTDFRSLEWTEASVPRVAGAGVYSFGNAELQTNASGEERMQLASVKATRYGAGSVVVSYKYTIPSTFNGETFCVYPSAYTSHKNRTFHSIDAADRGNYISLICDGEPPEITGLEAIDELDVLAMDEESESFIFTASDAISGLADFEITIENKDNYITKTIRDDADGAKDGVITITIPRYREGSTEGLEFCGDFTLTARAVDVVGNEQVESTDAAVLALEAEIERILEPHEPVFKRGESGILTIASWGYVEKVEVEFQAGLAELNKSYDYGDKLRYVQEEGLEFMIPLTLPDGEYPVKVTGYKTGTTLESRPVILSFTVRGSVLDELRTRLR